MIYSTKNPNVVIKVLEFDYGDDYHKQQALDEIEKTIRLGDNIYFIKNIPDSCYFFEGNKNGKIQIVFEVYRMQSDLENSMALKL